MKDIPELTIARQRAKELEVLKGKIKKTTKEWDKLGKRRQETLEHALDVIDEEDHRILPRKLRARKKMSKVALDRMVVRARFIVKETSSKKKYIALKPFHDVVVEEKRIRIELNTLYPKARDKLAELTHARKMVETELRKKTGECSDGQKSPTVEKAMSDSSPIEPSISSSSRARGRGENAMSDNSPMEPSMSSRRSWQGPSSRGRGRGNRGNSNIEEAEPSKTRPPPPPPPSKVNPPKNPPKPVITRQATTKRYLEFVGDWDVVCGAAQFRVVVSPLGNISMFRDDASWSVHNIPMIQIGSNLSLTIDEVEWRLTSMEDHSHASWTAPALPGVVSKWTRDIGRPANPKAAAANKPKSQAKAKTQAKAKSSETAPRLSPTMPPSQAFSATSPAVDTNDASSSTRPGYFYTEVRGDRLVWTDGSSQAFSDSEDRQKSKMQF